MTGTTEDAALSIPLGTTSKMGAAVVKRYDSVVRLTPQYPGPRIRKMSWKSRLDAADHVSVQVLSFSFGGLKDGEPTQTPRQQHCRHTGKPQPDR